MDGRTDEERSDAARRTINRKNRSDGDARIAAYATVLLVNVLIWLATIGFSLLQFFPWVLAIGVVYVVGANAALFVIYFGAGKGFVWHVALFGWTVWVFRSYSYYLADVQIDIAPWHHVFPNAIIVVCAWWGTVMLSPSGRAVHSRVHHFAFIVMFTVGLLPLGYDNMLLEPYYYSFIRVFIYSINYCLLALPNTRPCDGSSGAPGMRPTSTLVAALAGQWPLYVHLYVLALAVVQVPILIYATKDYIVPFVRLLTSTAGTFVRFPDTPQTDIDEQDESVQQQQQQVGGDLEEVLV